MAWPEFDTLFSGRGRRIDWAAARFDPRLPLLDCGSGTGAGVVALAEAFPDSRVVAVEPDEGMRAILMHRVVATPGLAGRVTVLPQRLDQVTLAGPLGGVVATGFLFFLPPDRRRAAWEWFARMLTPGAGVVFEDGDAPAPAADEPAALVDTRELGDLRYERWFSLGPLGDGSVRFTNTVRVLDGERQIAEDASSWQSWPLTEERGREEALATGGFDVQRLDDHHLVARRRTA